jgi:hypothetical protein
MHGDGDMGTVKLGRIVQQGAAMQHNEQYPDRG